MLGWPRRQRKDLTIAPDAKSTAALLALVVAVACCVALILLLVLPAREQVVNGLLIDLELGEADPSRYCQLREALTSGITDQTTGLQDVVVNLEYVHFSNVKPDLLESGRIGFLLLSPQGTPWHRYRGPAAEPLARTKEIVRDAAMNRGVPVLGICGGHQFLVLAFGGSVDFIDPKYIGQAPMHYPPEAIKERGVVELETTAADPIFEGVATYPGTFRAVESHFEEVKTVPRPFVNLARSRLSPIQVIRIPHRPVYGFAFHPERCWNEEQCGGAEVTEGKRLLANFLAMVARH